MLLEEFEQVRRRGFIVIDGMEATEDLHVWYHHACDERISLIVVSRLGNGSARVSFAGCDDRSAAVARQVAPELEWRGKVGTASGPLGEITALAERLAAPYACTCPLDLSKYRMVTQ